MSRSPDATDVNGHMIEPHFAEAFVRSAPWFFFFFFFSFLVAFAVLFAVAATS